MGGLLLGFLFFGGQSDPHSIDEHIAETHTDEGGNIVYTCSMHPQVRAEEPGDCPICGMELIPADEVDEDNGSVQNPNAVQFSQAALALADIQTTEVRKEIPIEETRLPGKVVVNQNLVSNITAHFPGRVRELYVDFTGDYISKGQRLASIYSPELITAQRELLETARLKEQNPRLYESARRKLMLWEFPEETIDQIEQSGEVMEELDFFAPVSGYVSEISISREDHITEGMVMYRIADLSDVWIEFEAYESTIGGLSTGDEVKFQVSSLGSQNFTGEVDFIQPFLNDDSRTVNVRVTTNNPDNRMKPGMFAEGVISSGSDQTEELLVPRSAVMWTGKRSIVFVDVSEANSPAFEAREVELGSRAGNDYVIEDGLEAGEQVVTNGTFKVDAAAQLSDKLSMMNRNPGSGANRGAHNHGDMEMDDSEVNGSEMEQMDDHSDHQMQEDPDAEISDEFREEFTDLLQIYLSLKDELIESNLENAVNRAEEFTAELEKIGEHRLEGDAHMAWMESYSAIMEQIELMTEANTIEVYREAFSQLSDQLIRDVKTFGIQGVVYHQYCPMAFDNEGADWLSSEEQIQNPYLPETMPGCGEVIERIEL